MITYQAWHRIKELAERDRLNACQIADELGRHPAPCASG